MTRSGRHQILRWTAAVLTVLVGVVLVVTVSRFIPAYRAEPTLSGQSGYLGTILGAVALLVVMVQSLRWLARREEPLGLLARLQLKVASDVAARAAQMRRTAEDIDLAYGAGGEPDTTLHALADGLRHRQTRVVLVAHPGRGKSYSTLRIALELVNDDPQVLPLVVPLSRWTGQSDITTWLAGFVAVELNVSRRSARELIESGDVLPLLDGLDELCSTEEAVEPAEWFLQRLVDWRLRGKRAPFLLTCRQATWRAIRADLREHHTLTSYTVRPVGYADATTYLSRSIGGTDRFPVAESLAESLRDAGQVRALKSPWQLSMVAELARNRRSIGGSSEQLVTGAEAADVRSLVARYVESVVLSGSMWRRLRNVADLYWLSRYARYLEHNRVTQASFAGRALPSHDIVLHRLWPIAGRRVPRLVDLAICVLMSAPGFVWLTLFLWPRGWLGRGVLLIGALTWVAMLARTSTKPWVPAATPDWSRLGNPRFFLPQAATALLIGAAAWVLVDPLVGLIGFATSWLAIGLTVGFGQTLATDARPEIVGPLGVLRHERTVSRLSAAVVCPAVVWGFSYTWGLWPGAVLGIGYCVIVGETVACALWRRYLAMIVASAFRMPPAPARCLQRMCAFGFLRPAGISYQFRHDDLLSHFAHRHDAREHLSRVRAGAGARQQARPTVE
ncbi:NACHT domain-containing protein [Micromonospora sp. NBC_00362]|nr:NACHT domain-containing protein [Micromonospora sp. NBC_00362]